MNCATAQLEMWDIAGTPQPSPAPASGSPAASKLSLRPYQLECLQAIEAAGPGRWLCQLATGLGKTVIFSSLKTSILGVSGSRPLVPGRLLLLSHREELVQTPRRYFRCSFGVEQGAERSRGQEVVSASVQSLAGRLNCFHPEAFDAIVTDEAHHAAADTYQRIYEYFRPRLHLGFTATPNRGDGVKLDNVFDAIIFERDLKWGIEHGWLAALDCLRVNIGYDLAAVRSRMGDYAPGELEKAVNIDGANKAIAEAYKKYAIGPTLVFGVSRDHCRKIAALIEGAVVVDGETKGRAEIFEAFSAGQIPCLVNCQIATEGTDLPATRTVIIARPTQSVALYTQMVGRGTRKPAGKERCLLIDCVGASRLNICTAPSLIGLDMSQVPAKYQMDVVGDLLADLPPIIAHAMDTPESWIKNTEWVSLWAKQEHLDLRGVNYFKHADGTLAVDLPGKKWLKVSPPDLRGMARVYNSAGRFSKVMPLQDCLAFAHRTLEQHAGQERPLWSLDSFKRWGKKPASDKQKNLVKRFCRDFDVENLTCGEANLILKRKMGR